MGFGEMVVEDRAERFGAMGAAARGDGVGKNF